jgi:restriction system protein
MWGIHNVRPDVSFVDSGFVAIGWMAMPDLRRVGDDRDAMKAALAAAYPDAGPRALAAWAGMLLRFAFEMRPGDLVVHPDKRERTVGVGRIASDYRFDEGAPDLRHRRDVTWLATGAPRTLFSKGALYEIGSSLTLFRVRRNAGEFAALAPGEAVPLRPQGGLRAVAHPDPLEDPGEVSLHGRLGDLEPPRDQLVR